MGFFVAPLLRMTVEYTVSGWQLIDGKREMKTELGQGKGLWVKIVCCFGIMD
jgi:hypothetical protein